MSIQVHAKEENKVRRAMAANRKCDNVGDYEDIVSDGTRLLRFRYEAWTLHQAMSREIGNRDGLLLVGGRPKSNYGQGFPGDKLEETTCFLRPRSYK